MEVTFYVEEVSIWIYKKTPHNVFWFFFSWNSAAGVIYLAMKHNTPDHWYPTDLEKRTRVNDLLDWRHTTIRKQGTAAFFPQVRISFDALYQAIPSRAFWSEIFNVYSIWGFYTAGIHGHTPIGFLFVRRDINMKKKNSKNALTLTLLHGKVQNLN